MQSETIFYVFTPVYLSPFLKTDHNHIQKTIIYKTLTRLFKYVVKTPVST